MAKSKDQHDPARRYEPVTTDPVQYFVRCYRLVRIPWAKGEDMGDALARVVGEIAPRDAFVRVAAASQDREEYCVLLEWDEKQEKQ